MAFFGIKFLGITSVSWYPIQFLGIPSIDGSSSKLGQLCLGPPGALFQVCAVLGFSPTFFGFSEDKCSEILSVTQNYGTPR